MNVDRKLAAIVFTDIVGFTKIMTESEDKAFSILSSQDRIINPLLTEFKGNLLKKMGDGLLIEFESTVNAVECSIKIQSAIEEHNKDNSENNFKIRIGIHLGDVLKMGDDILGDGVNIASRIEPLAEPGGICITQAVQSSIQSKLKIDSKKIDEVDLKHIVDKYTIYKFPVNIEESEDNSHPIDIESDKIKINYLEKTSTLLSRCVSGFKDVGCKTGLYFASFMVICEVVLIYYILGVYLQIHQDFLDPELIDVERIIFHFIGRFLFFGIAMSYTTGTIKYKVSFEDIRKVIPTLDLIIKRGWYYGKWELKLNQNNKISYVTHGTKFHNYMMTKWWSPFPKLTQSITCLIDGNTIEISGSGSKLKQSINALKKISVNL